MNVQFRETRRNDGLKSPLFMFLAFLMILFLADDDFGQVMSPDKSIATLIFLDDEGRLNYESYYDDERIAGPEILNVSFAGGLGITGIQSIHEVERRKVFSSEPANPYVFVKYEISHDLGVYSLELRHFNSNLQYKKNISGDTALWENIRLGRKIQTHHQPVLTSS